MSEFEYSSSSNEESSEDEELVFPITSKQKKYAHNAIKVSRELRTYYSNLFIDSYNLIDLFIKKKTLTYSSFLEVFNSSMFHEIYAKPNREKKHTYLAPHHYITTTQDSLAVATKFLRSKSRQARIGAVYLLYTINVTQPFKRYLIDIKMVRKDYFNTKELVHSCFNEGLRDPSFCFYRLDISRKITITATVINPCLEANYPRAEVRKFMGRVADKCFKVEYEERKDFDPSNRLHLMEYQMRNELAYINKLSNLSLGRDVASEHKPELSRAIVEISAAKNVTTDEQKNNDIECPKKTRYKNTNIRAFPGRNEDVLEDMVEFSVPPILDKHVNNCHPKKKLKLSRRKILKKHAKKEEPQDTISTLPRLSTILDSDSSCPSINSDDDDYYGNTYGDMIWRILEGQEISEVIDHSTIDQEEDIKM
ncbi:uncharacterized protein LOC100160693 [Acyrthosiphon pisum]|uniref:Uncharacterized protein n=1 Tax=Acyrthosiphon pisum TaxID=7029 RepID=A0A8R2D449_ACYPI|nr:uncharacterized protein LOC100160693 [Acyrthosiphon pisum]XP_016660515.1 uncharacterized protein LOC100160693 [Acyrthosiphon pisum]XP_016660516.1 uncharacterized protein LOC100160693 [Acyrthosiphon pisum]|eukprot:XP_016660514.1 PREDICTED: uncharacterized protein LOC100160693 [Acyrthosiphon pisum]